MTAAKKEDWQTKNFPGTTKELPFQRRFSPEEMEQLKRGLVPKEMEDKWFIYYEADALHFHRSWTGHKIFQVTFLPSAEQPHVLQTIVNRDPAEYNQADDAYNIELVNFLIDRLLLGKPVPFPTPKNMDQSDCQLYRHALAGHGRPNKEE